MLEVDAIWEPNSKTGISQAQFLSGMKAAARLGQSMQNAETGEDGVNPDQLIAWFDPDEPGSGSG